MEKLKKASSNFQLYITQSLRLHSSSHRLYHSRVARPFEVVEVVAGEDGVVVASGAAEALHHGTIRLGAFLQTIQTAHRITRSAATRLVDFPREEVVRPFAVVEAAVWAFIITAAHLLRPIFLPLSSCTTIRPMPRSITVMNTGVTTTVWEETTARPRRHRTIPAATPATIILRRPTTETGPAFHLIVVDVVVEVAAVTFISITAHLSRPRRRRSFPTCLLININHSSSRPLKEDPHRPHLPCTTLHPTEEVTVAFVRPGDEASSVGGDRRI